jgi:hypothetical protein
VPRLIRYSRWLLLFVAFLPLSTNRVLSAEPAPKVYVLLWFDTEDYLLPASDDSAKHLAEFLTAEGIRGTFKVVGEKARVLEKRQRNDVIAALKKHEIGYHSNFHSVQPSPAMYLSNLGWDEGVEEFDRREGPGRADVERVFGVAPTTYGQPGSSWAPQSYGAMWKWGMRVYLDGGRHVGVDAKPHYYGGILNLYWLAHMPRVGLADPKDVPAAEEKFAAARKALLAEGGGVVSIIYHPCEFVHKKFWDGVNFRAGANPPRDKWQIPPQKTPEETRVAFDNFERYVRFMKRFPDVQFITASDALKLYQDVAPDRVFMLKDVRAIAAAVGDDITFQKTDSLTLSPAEVFWLLTIFWNAKPDNTSGVAMLDPAPVYGPTGTVPTLTDVVTTDRSQFLRTLGAVRRYMERHHRIPSAVWLGSKAVPPEAFLRTLAQLAIAKIDGKEIPETLEIKPTKLAVSKYVADDDPKLWNWVIFPPGFHAPEMMELARKQAWTIKPALLNPHAFER